MFYKLHREGGTQFFEITEQLLERGGKIVFNLDDVDFKSAGKGFDSFMDAARLDKITEWELNQILTDSNLSAITTFVRNGEVVKFDDLVKVTSDQ